MGAPARTATGAGAPSRAAPTDRGRATVTHDRPPRRPPAPTPAAAEPARRLEQHFVYNALNTIAALIRTDPGRARELLFGFADLSRVADQPGDATSTLGQELDAVRGYLQLEQARFGKRLRVELDLDPGLDRVPVRPMAVLGAVRAAVQQASSHAPRAACSPCAPPRPRAARRSRSAAVPAARW